MADQKNMEMIYEFTANYMIKMYSEQQDNNLNTFLNQQKI